MRFLHSDPQSRAIGFMVKAQSLEFAEFASEGRYWRHAPVVRFSDTPCPEGLPYEGLGTYTRSVLQRLGYADSEIARLVAARAIALARGEPSPAPK
jgi:crotonobetainyl-CoA:carnitine CoA-transferase CaiB-like acyl-CoA transferase